MRTPAPQAVTNRVELDPDLYKGFEDCANRSMNMMAMAYLVEIVKAQRDDIAALKEEVTTLTKHNTKASPGPRAKTETDGSA